MHCRILKLVFLVFLPLLPAYIIAAQVFYVLPDGGVEVNEVEIPEEENPFLFVFNVLSNPPDPYLKLLPENAFRAVYVVKDTLYLDFYGEKFEGYSFDDYRYLIHSLLATVFNSFEGINWVKFLIDGRDDVPLGGVIEITYMFSKEVWKKWPIQIP